MLNCYCSMNQDAVPIYLITQPELAAWVNNQTAQTQTDSSNKKLKDERGESWVYLSASNHMLLALFIVLGNSDLTKASDCAAYNKIIGVSSMLGRATEAAIKGWDLTSDQYLSLYVPANDLEESSIFFDTPCDNPKHLVYLHDVATKLSAALDANVQSLE